MKTILTMILIYCLAVTSVFGQATNPSDTLKIGKASSASDKGFIFDTNDGVSNKKLTIEKVSKKLKWDGNSVQIGDGSAGSDKTISINGASKSLKYNGTSGEFEFDDTLKLSNDLKANTINPASGTETSIEQDARVKGKLNIGTGANELRVAGGNLEFSNDGSLYKKIGSGTGSGGGGGTQLLTNDSFEDGISSPWTSSGGTFSQQTYSIGSESDLKYARFIASGSGQYVEQIVSIPTDFSGGCQADFKKVNISTAGLFKVQALDASNNVLAEQTIGISNWIKVPTISFVCPVSGTNNLKLRLISLAAGTIDFDKGYIGSNQNVVQSNISATEWAKYTVKAGFGSTNTRVPYFTNIQENQTGKLISITNNSTLGFSVTALKNNVRVDVHFSEAVALSSFNALVHNGTLSDFTAATIGSIPAIRLISTGYTGGGNEAQIVSASKILQINETITPANYSSVLDGTSAKSVILVTATEISPNGEQMVSPEQSSWFIDANIGGANPTLGIVNVSSYSPIANGSLDLVVNSSKGSAVAEIPCDAGNASSGLTCTTGNEQIGVAFTPAMTGLHEVCFDFTHLAGASNYLISTFQLVETSNTSTAIITEGGVRVTSGASPSTIDNDYNANKICGNFVFSDTSKKTIRLMYEQSQASGSQSLILADRAAAQGQQDIHVTVKNLTFGQNRPILTGDQITSKGVANPKLFTASVSSTGIVTNDYSDFINGNCVMSGGGSSSATCTFNSGIFTTYSACWVPTPPQMNFAGVTNTGSIINTLVRMQSTGGTDIATAFQLFCWGF